MCLVGSPQRHVFASSTADPHPDLVPDTLHICAFHRPASWRQAARRHPQTTAAAAAQAAAAAGVAPRRAPRSAARASRWRQTCWACRRSRPITAPRCTIPAVALQSLQPSCIARCNPGHCSAVKRDCSSAHQPRQCQCQQPSSSCAAVRQSCLRVRHLGDGTRKQTGAAAVSLADASSQNGRKRSPCLLAKGEEKEPAQKCLPKGMSPRQGSDASWLPHIDGSGVTKHDLPRFNIWMRLWTRRGAMWGWVTWTTGAESYCLCIEYQSWRSTAGCGCGMGRRGAGRPGRLEPLPGGAGPGLPARRLWRRLVRHRRRRLAARRRVSSVTSSSLFMRLLFCHPYLCLLVPLAH